MTITRLDQLGELGWSHETAQPEQSMLANAIQVWSVCQERRTTVQEVAVAFNVSLDLARAAVSSHYWMTLAGDVIEHEGD